MPGRFVLIDDATYTFELTADYDPNRELIIDPDLAWSTYLGGGGDDLGRGIAVDAAGNALVTGWNSSGGNYAIAFVAKVSSSGALAWTTYLGGGGNDYGGGIAVDAAGNALVTGHTGSTDFSGANNAHHGGGYNDAFVAKVSSSGALAWATYVGGSGHDRGYGIAVDAAGNALVSGETRSADFSGRNNSYHGGLDAFVAKVSSSGALAWATYLGGSGNDEGYGIVVDAAGNALVTGRTHSTDFSGRNNAKHSGYDAFVAKVSSSGALAWATYLGGHADDGGRGIAVDAAGNALVTGYTASTDFSGANNAYHGSSNDAFVAKVSPGGAVQWATYLGGSGNELGSGIGVDAGGNALVTGHTWSIDFEGRNNVYHGGGWDPFVAKVSPAGALQGATYLGGTGYDMGMGIAVDAAGNALVTGKTTSTDFEGRNNSYHGGYDAFVARIGTGGGDHAVFEILARGVAYDDRWQEPEPGQDPQEVWFDGQNLGYTVSKVFDYFDCCTYGMFASCFPDEG